MWRLFNIKLYIPVLSEYIQATSVALRDINTHKVSYRMQEIRNDRKTVLIKSFGTLVLIRDIPVIRGTNKCPVRSASVKDYAEIRLSSFNAAVERIKSEILLISPENIPCIYLFLNIVEAAVIAIGDYSVGLRLELVQVVYYYTSEECLALIERRLVDYDSSALSLYALHYALYGGLAKVVAI